MGEQLARGVLLIAHGTVDALDDLPEFLANIRRGHAAPPELVAEVRRRYEAIGGQSPLNAINRALAAALEAKLRVPVAVANRLFRPYPKEALEALAARGAKTIDVVPLAQHSAAVYAGAAEAAAREVPGIRVQCAPNWGREPALIRAYADAVEAALRQVPAPSDAALVLTAHSLPQAIIDAGDPYEAEFRGSAEDVVRELQARGVPFGEHVIAFQSQGMSAGPGGRPMAWLGPDLRSTLEAVAARGRKHVVIAPIGFLADHVEILYDLDIEAKVWAEQLGMACYRSASLNASSALVDVLSAVAQRGG